MWEWIAGRGRGEGGEGVGQLNSNQCVKTRGQAMRPKLWSAVILNLQILSTSRFGWYNFIITNQVLVVVSDGDGDVRIHQSKLCHRKIEVARFYRLLVKLSKF